MELIFYTTKQSVMENASIQVVSIFSTTFISVLATYMAEGLRGIFFWENLSISFVVWIVDRDFHWCSISGLCM